MNPSRDDNLTNDGTANLAKNLGGYTGGDHYGSSSRKNAKWRQRNGQSFWSS
jgi:hypothetical protein